MGCGTLGAIGLVIGLFGVRSAKIQVVIESWIHSFQLKIFQSFLPNEHSSNRRLVAGQTAQAVQFECRGSIKIMQCAITSN